MMPPRAGSNNGLRDFDLNQKWDDLRQWIEDFYERRGMPKPRYIELYTDVYNNCKSVHQSAANPENKRTTGIRRDRNSRYVSWTRMSLKLLNFTITLFWKMLQLAMFMILLSSSSQSLPIYGSTKYGGSLNFARAPTPSAMQQSHQRIFGYAAPSSTADKSRGSSAPTSSSAMQQSHQRIFGYAAPSSTADKSRGSSAPTSSSAMQQSHQRIFGYAAPSSGNAGISPPSKSRYDMSQPSQGDNEMSKPSQAQVESKSMQNTHVSYSAIPKSRLGESHIVPKSRLGESHIVPKSRLGESHIVPKSRLGDHPILISSLNYPFDRSSLIEATTLTFETQTEKSSDDLANPKEESNTSTGIRCKRSDPAETCDSAATQRTKMPRLADESQEIVPRENSPPMPTLADESQEIVPRENSPPMPTLADESQEIVPGENSQPVPGRSRIHVKILKSSDLLIDVQNWLDKKLMTSGTGGHILANDFLTKETAYKCSVYFLENTRTKTTYVGTKFGETNTPCQIWSSKGGDLYTSSRKDDNDEYKYLGRITYAGNTNPYSSDSTAESHALYLRILQAVGQNILPDTYGAAANIHLRRTGIAWDLEELQKHIVDDIKNRRQMMNAIPPSNKFFKDLRPVSSTIAKLVNPAVDGISNQLIINSLNAVLDDYKIAMKNEKTGEGSSHSGDVAGMPIDQYKENIDLGINPEPVTAYEINRPQSAQPANNDDDVEEEGLELKDIVREDGKYYSTVYIMQNLETGEMYIGSKTGKFARPCVIWRQIPGTELYKSTRLNDEKSVYTHVQSFLWSTTSEDYTQVLMAGDSHAAFSQLFQQAANKFKPDLYSKSANINQKIKPIVWKTGDICSAITKGIEKQESILELLPPTNRFISPKETVLESVMTGSIMFPYTELDMALAVQDYESGLSILDASQINNVPPYNLNHNLKMKGINLRDQGGPITRDDINEALEMLEVENEKGEHPNSMQDILQKWPQFSEEQIKRYQHNPSLISHIPLTDEQKKSIINVIRAGAGSQATADYFNIGRSTVVLLTRYVRRANNLLEEYGEPDFETVENLQAKRVTFSEDELSPAYELLLKNLKMTYATAAKSVPGLKGFTLFNRFRKKYPEVASKRLGTRITQVYSDDELLEGYQSAQENTIIVGYRLLRAKDIRISIGGFSERFQEWRRVNNIPVSPKNIFHHVKNVHNIELAFDYVNDESNKGDTRWKKVEIAFKKYPNIVKRISSATFHRRFDAYVELHPDKEPVLLSDPNQ